MHDIPDGCNGVIAHLICDGARAAIDFYKEAFGAEELFTAPVPGSDKLMHSELMLSGSRVYVADDFPEFNEGKTRHPKALGGTGVTIHRYVTDVDAAFARATGAGAQVKMPPMDMFWGDRYAVVEDAWGHQWSFAEHLRDVSPEEMAAAAEAMFSGGGPPAE